MTRAHRLYALVMAAVLGVGAHAILAGDQGAAEPAGREAGPQEPRAVTVPFTTDHNRMIVEVDLVRPDGTVVKVPAWVDTGSEALVVTEPLARELGLDLPDLEGDESQESAETTSPPPRVRIGGLSLDVEGVATWVRRGTWIMPGVPAEVHLGASVLRHCHVVFDYPARRLTVARAGVLEPRGVPIPCRVNPTTGLFMISATIDGDPVPVGLDNGSAGTWVSMELTGAWQERHPEWRHVRGALGSANFWGLAFETGGVLMRLPEVGIGSIRVHDVALLGLGQGLFDWYSRKSAATVAGFLGANILKRFRLEVDFANQMTYWEAGRQEDDHDLDIVGITVRADDDGGFTVAGVVSIDGTPAVAGVAAGDRIVKVGPLEVAGATMGQVMDALRGQPGATRTLEVEHDNHPITVRAEVMRFP